ncbi:hypothetical protein Q1695_015994 [Nippostrongylus brasiliensis]|nr:hypothetical protein Q1695_015994 [Nippostrongylus brasiliensis]
MDMTSVFLAEGSSEIHLVGDVSACVVQCYYNDTNKANRRPAGPERPPRRPPARKPVHLRKASPGTMSTKSPRSLYVLVTIQAAHLVTACPPQPIGNCYAGTVLISSPYTGGIVTRKCAPTLNREWCAVSFYASTSTASFGCANDFTIPFGSMTCGDGPGFINQQGCSMANTASGPCYFCCCRGGSCNHPEDYKRYKGIKESKWYQGYKDSKNISNYYCEVQHSMCSPCSW